MRFAPAARGIRKSTKRWLGSLVLVMALAALAGVVANIA